MTGEREITALSEFMNYLARENGDDDRLPPLVDLSRRLGVSTATLREQLEVARALGLVEVRPRTGIRRLPYRFTPAVVKSLTYAAAVDPAYFFSAYSDLRAHIESSYWFQAVRLLTPSDHDYLRGLVDSALAKLAGTPVSIPHYEHRELHLSIYSRLDNPFVTGILEAYWDAYEAVGLNLYTDLSYLSNVWRYHKRMVDAVCSGNFQDGYHALMEHTDLLHDRPAVAARPVIRHEFE